MKTGKIIKTNAYEDSIQFEELLLALLFEISQNRSLTYV